VILREADARIEGVRGRSRDEGQQECGKEREAALQTRGGNRVATGHEP